MRFTNLLTLLAATSSLAYTIKREELMDSLNDSTQVETQVTDSPNLNGSPDLNGTPNLNTPECGKLIMSFNNCFGGVTEDTSNQEACNRYSSNECQNFLKQDINACGEEIKNTYSAITSVLKANCSKDEKGNNCPQFKLLQDENAVLTDTDIQEICKSKACTNSALEGFTEMKQIATILAKSDDEIAKDIPELDKYINALNNDKCKAATTTVSNTATNTTTNATSTGKTAADEDDSSDATQIRIGSTLLATLALALYLF